MKTTLNLRFSIVPLAFLFLMGHFKNSASADVVLDFQFEAEVIGVFDEYGLFGTIAEGDGLTGRLRYGNQVSFEDGDDTFIYRELSVLPGGVNQMSVSIGELTFGATQKFIAQSYNMEFDVDSIYGTDFQFNDADTSILNLANLPSGYQVRLGALVALFLNDPTLSTFPELPSSLLQLDMYDGWATGGFVYADLYNAQGQFIDFAIVEFRLTSLTTVPEPSSGLLAFTGLMLCRVRLGRRRAIA